MRVDTCHRGEFQCTDSVYESGWGVTLCLTDSEVAEILSLYDPASSSSPDEKSSQEVFRLILDSILSKMS